MNAIKAPQGEHGGHVMDGKIRAQVISRLIERMDRAIPGDTQDELVERYVPVFQKMTGHELGSVWERTAAYSDAQLYIIDEQVYQHLKKRGNSPRIGSDVNVLFHTVIRG